MSSLAMVLALAAVENKGKPPAYDRDGILGVVEALAAGDRDPRRDVPRLPGVRVHVVRARRADDHDATCSARRSSRSPASTARTSRPACSGCCTLLAIDCKRGLGPKDALLVDICRAVLALRRRRLDRDLHARLPHPVARWLTISIARRTPARRPRDGRGARASDLEAVQVGRAHPDAHHRRRGLGLLHPGVRRLAALRAGAADHVGGEVRDRRACSTCTSSTTTSCSARCSPGR